MDRNTKNRGLKTQVKYLMMTKRYFLQDRKTILLTILSDFLHNLKHLWFYISKYISKIHYGILF